MSELIKTRTDNGGLQLAFLAGASTLALLSVVCASQSMASGQEDRPTIWIELGGQLERVSGTGAPFSPEFLVKNSDAAVFEPTSPLEAQHLPRYSLGEEGKISFQPQKSDWIFTAALRYGRSNGSKDFEHQTNGIIGKRRIFLSQPPVSFTTVVHSFSEVQTRQKESHLILDFQAGKDVGLGSFGGASVVNVGVRFAQLTSKAQVNLQVRPDVELYKTFPFSNHEKYTSRARFHDYSLAARSERSFHGIGPSLSWNGSIPLAGGEREAQLDLDLGLNGAVLFGRQKVNLEHKTTAKSEKAFVYHPLYQRSFAPSRSHSIAVPNIGAFAGISYRMASFKMSAGYRADFFVGAMDTGVDTSDRTTASFHGPYATISVGLGN